jgi:tetratricopeptide (TPR) repeat protein
VPARTPPRWVGALVRPLPAWARIAGSVAVLLFLGLIFLSGDDWGDGSARAGIAAAILAFVAAVLVGMRFFAAMAIDTSSKPQRRLVDGGVLVALLLVTYAAGVGAAAPLHRSEAGVYEAQREWQHAVGEYTRVGETGTNAADLARVYDEWGEQLSASGAYGEAIDKFQLVLASYSAVPAADARAQADSITAYLAWGQQALQQQDYSGAQQRLDTLLALSYCATDCQAQGAPRDATAYYGVAEAKLTAGDYQGAVDSFHVLLNRFQSAPEVAKAHGDVAKALLGLGQQQLTSGTCSSAVPTYRELASKYTDTSQGQQASAALAAPQPVTGQFTKGVPAGAFVILAHNLSYNMPNSQYLAAVAPPAPRTDVHGDGTFRFNAIGQGTWDLVWAVSTSSGEFYLFTAHPNDNSPVWVANVGPLCPFDFGSIDESFPTP